MSQDNVYNEGSRQMGALAQYLEALYKYEEKQQEKQ